MVLPFLLRYNLEVGIDVVALLLPVEDDDLAPCLELFIRPIFGNVIEVTIQMQASLAIRRVQRVRVECLRMADQSHVGRKSLW